jgi:hypothetical protein
VIWANSYGSTGDDAENNLAVDSYEYIYVTCFFVNTTKMGANNLISSGLADSYMLK